VLRVTDRVPRDSPFGNQVWTRGHRNVEGLAFDGPRLWAGELGDRRQDELNQVVRGGNFGWPYVVGGDGRGGYRDPLASWDTDTCSPSGLAVVHGNAWLGALQGECLYSVVLHGGRWRPLPTARCGSARRTATAGPRLAPATTGCCGVAFG
jgi:glucose/arabinose dehydrogenase